jgi:hypothetical protein
MQNDELQTRSHNELEEYSIDWESNLDRYIDR